LRHSLSHIRLTHRTNHFTQSQIQVTQSQIPGGDRLVVRGAHVGPKEAVQSRGGTDQL
jgi:hypothetical protein